MKRALILFITMIAAVFAATTPGVVHIVFDNGEVTTSGDDTFYEFDIQAYITGTTNPDDLIIGDATIYVEYDTEIFGSSVVASGNVSVTQEGVLAHQSFPGYFGYETYNSNDTYSDVFSLAFGALYSSPALYEAVSSDPGNPSDLYHIKIKATAAGSGEVLSPIARIGDADVQYFALSGAQYAGPNDFSAAVEPVYIEGPIGGEPYTSIELDYFNAENKGGKVRLRWRTQSETENLGFIVKRALVLAGDQYGVYEEIDTYLENEDLLGAGTTTKKTDYIYWDRSVRPGATYAYVLQDVDSGGHIRECAPVLITIKDNKVISTDKFEFSASYPNPFNPAFVVPFELYTSTSVDIKLYDISGKLVKEIANQEFSSGTHRLMVNGDQLSSGVYLLKIRVDNIVSTQKMLLVK